MDYKEIVNRAYSNEILVGVEPALARKFFTDTNHEAVQEQIGESLYLERWVVISLAFILQPISLLAGIVLCIFALHWYSMLVAPIMFLGWFVYGGLASAGRQKLSEFFCSLLCVSF